MGNSQAEGLIGAMVDRMIRRSVQKSFRRVSWLRPSALPEGPIIYVPNHHGWHDGYVMYHAVTALQRPTIDWIQEYDAFPLFRKVGGLPFPLNDQATRVKTIRHTIRELDAGRKDLLLFAEGVLHRPTEILPFQKSLEMILRHVPQASVIPVAIRYEMAIHERPECHLMFGTPVPSGPMLLDRSRLALKALLDLLEVKVRFHSDDFEPLVKGTADVNERMDMRNIPFKTSR